MKIKFLLDGAKTVDTAVLIAEERYRLIEKIMEAAVRKPRRKRKALPKKSTESPLTRFLHSRFF